MQWYKYIYTLRDNDEDDEDDEDDDDVFTVGGLEIAAPATCARYTVRTAAEVCY